MAYTSSVFSTTFTPTYDAVVEVVATFDAAASTSYGGAVASVLYITQSGVTKYSPALPIAKTGGTFARHVQRFRFEVTGSVLATVGVMGLVSGPYSLTWRNIALSGIEVQLI